MTTQRMPPDSAGPAGGAAPPDNGRDAVFKSYRYLRLAMVGLLAAIAAAVLYQSLQQGGILGSVSAYYYTPAQAIFVSGLVGLGACMIALRGETPAEEILLNLGGMFAAVVALVPTGRPGEFREVIRACRDAGTPLLTERAATGLDCPTVQALADATRANVENNLFALLVVGAGGLVVSMVFARTDTKLMDGYWFGIGLASALWAAMLVAYLTALQWVIDNAHVVAAVALAVCVVLVTLVNALRIERKTTAPHPAPRMGDKIGELITVARSGNRYVWIAGVAVGAAVVASGLRLAGIISVFWLEAIVGVFFMWFWVVQTIELDGPG